jgi:small-conductance mechanosensitive channel
MANDKNKPQWGVKQGVATRTRGATEETVVEVPPAQLDRTIQRLGKRKEQLAQRLAQVQANYDAVVAEEAELVALREQVTD